MGVQEAARLPMQAELGPGEHFEEFIERAPPARQRDEAIGKVVHQCLALVHRRDNPQLRQAVVSNFLRDQTFRDDAGDQASAGEDRISDCTHQTDARTPVDNPDPARDERSSELLRGACILGPRTRA